MATRPVVASHTGLRGCCDNARNLSDEHARAIAATGGVLGIGFWPTACGGDDVGVDRPLDPLRRRRRRRASTSPSAPISTARSRSRSTPPGMVLLTDALLAAGLDDATVAGVMGGNVRRLLAEALPDR